MREDGSIPVEVLRAIISQNMRSTGSTSIKSGRIMIYWYHTDRQKADSCPQKLNILILSESLKYNYLVFVGSGLSF